jgi:integrase
MAILAECPTCHKKQSNKNKKCKCGANLDAARKTQRLKYWIAYRVGGKLRRESVAAMEGLKGNSIEDARAALSKRTVQKRENRVMDMLPESKMTFNQLAEWYLDLEKVKALSSFWLVELTLKKFNAVFGDTIVGDIKLADLQNYQARRLAADKAPATVDHEIRKTKTMIIAAFDNDKVSGTVLKVFKKCKPTLKKGSDVRDRILSRDEYDKIMDNLSRHARPVFAMGYWAGMRRGEIMGLTWDKVDLKGRVIELEAADTKDDEPRTIPICKPLYEILKDIPRAIHDNHVFLYRGKPMRDIRRSLTKACEDAGVVYGRFEKSGFIFHDLRHTFNTNMRKAGVAESVIMSITGHSTREMFDRYNTVDLGDAQTAVHQLDVFLESVHQNVHQVAIDEKK